MILGDKVRSDKVRRGDVARTPNGSRMASDITIRRLRMDILRLSQPWTLAKAAYAPALKSTLSTMAPEMRILLSVQVPSLVLGDIVSRFTMAIRPDTLPQLTHKFDTSQRKYETRLQAVGVRSFIRGADTSLDSRAFKEGKTIFRIGDPRNTERRMTPRGTWHGAFLGSIIALFSIAYSYFLHVPISYERQHLNPFEASLVSQRPLH